MTIRRSGIMSMSGVNGILYRRGRILAYARQGM